MELRFSSSRLRSMSLCLHSVIYLSIFLVTCIFVFALAIINSASKLFPNHECPSDLSEPRLSIYGVIPENPFLRGQD